MREQIAHQTFDEERSLYHIADTDVTDCVFAGPADGESVLKEVRDVKVEECCFSLRYPLWHARKFQLVNSRLDDMTRAPIWYSEEGRIIDCMITGIKCLRECRNIFLEGSTVLSPEFGWRCTDLKIVDCEMQSEYFLFESRQMEIKKLKMKGKYSFQYVENVHISDSVLDTKDAFWHSRNVTVENSVVRGEYLGWFSEGLTLINCRIIGTQPLCYCRNLKLVDCTMEETDLSFEYSEVEADIRGNILSVKNPKSGKITADSIGEIIWEDSIMETSAQVIVREQK